jgi:hypothetical protein
MVCCVHFVTLMSYKCVMHKYMHERRETAYCRRRDGASNWDTIVYQDARTINMGMYMILTRDKAVQQSRVDAATSQDSNSSNTKVLCPPP